MMQELVLIKMHRMLLRPEVQSHTTALKQQLPRRAFGPRFLRLFKRRELVSLTGMHQPKERIVVRQQKIALQSDLLTRFSRTMLSSEEYIPLPQSKGYWKKRQRDSS
jgi:hypothetical protein